MAFSYYNKAYYVVLRRKMFPKKFEDLSKPIAFLFYKDSTLLGNQYFLEKRAFFSKLSSNIALCTIVKHIM